jgi:hypothetical protein
VLAIGTDLPDHQRDARLHTGRAALDVRESRLLACQQVIEAYDQRRIEKVSIDGK